MPAEEPTREPQLLVCRFGDFDLDLCSHRLSCAGRPLAVEPRVFDALVHLLANRERLVTKEREQAIETGWRQHWRDVADPGLQPLRADPRLQAQLLRMSRLVETMRERVRLEVERELPRLLQARGQRG